MYEIYDSRKIEATVLSLSILPARSWRMSEIGPGKHDDDVCFCFFGVFFCNNYQKGTDEGVVI